MLGFLLKLVPALIFWGIFAYIVLQVPYPNSLTQANVFQLLGFFIPLFLALTFTLKKVLKSFTMSMVLSLGIIILLILKALGVLNFVTGSLTILAIYLLTSSSKKSPTGLTSTSNIPKLTQWRKRR